MAFVSTLAVMSVAPPDSPHSHSSDFDLLKDSFADYRR
jgi:hypothetical protein